MTKLQKLKNASFGIIMIITAIVMAIYPRDAYEYVIAFMAMGFLVSGVAKLGYYFTMARYMVGGRSILYSAVIILDFGMLILGFTSLPGIYLAFYLGVMHLISGGVDLYNAIEAKRLSAPSWKWGAETLFCHRS